MDFTFSDLIAGYVASADASKGTFALKTSDGRQFNLKLTASTFAEMTRNLGEAYSDCTGQMRDMITPGRFLYAYGVFYPEPDKSFEAKHIVFVGRNPGDFVFETQDWWIKQIRQLGDFYIRAQFGDDGDIDYKNYRTNLNLYGDQIQTTRQETDTISRLVYGFASAYLLTGEERFLEAAEKGTAYLREHFRAVDATENVCYWYHAIDISQDQSRKILGSHMAEVPGLRESKAAGGKSGARKFLSSEFGDDYDAIPAYEQIYALAGPTQTYRITGDPLIRRDIDRTLNLFGKFFLDREKGGYFSHIDPITFDPLSEMLGENRGCKNWNSVGDHAPAYLINLALATGEKEHLDMLIATADSIADHFPDYENSDFVQEKFHADWSKDQKHGWQQNRAVVGHNLKIAWNLTRIYNLKAKPKYLDLAKKIAERMPKAGMDAQRGGWYDVVERNLDAGEKFHRYVWHDRKAWWQQEQGILAYLIMAGTLKTPDYVKYARESSAFYNAWFLDHDSGAVYFNVLANGLPYLLGTERMKGSHSMSGYHSFELCYLAAVYGNLLVNKQPMDLYFKPKPNGFKDNILRVAPDYLPADSIRIESVTINGEAHRDFDAKALTVKLPASNEPLKVKVRIAPMDGLDHFTVQLASANGIAKVTLEGDLDARAVPHLREVLAKAIASKPRRLVLLVSGLRSISGPATRTLIFEKEKMDLNEEFYVVGATGPVKAIFDSDEFSEEVELLERYDAKKLES